MQETFHIHKNTIRKLRLKEMAVEQDKAPEEQLSDVETGNYLKFDIE